MFARAEFVLALKHGAARIPVLARQRAKHRDTVCVRLRCGLAKGVTVPITAVGLKLLVKSLAEKPQRYCVEFG